MAFKEDFWFAFLKVWIRGASWIFNAAWFYQAEHQIINYYICSGVDPTEDFKKPLKLYATTELGCFIINILVYVRIKIFKFRSQPQPTVIPIRNGLLNIHKNSSIPSFATNLINLSTIASMLLTSAYISKVPPSRLKYYANEMFLFYLVAPGFTFGILMSVYYIKHEPLKNAAIVELKNWFCYIKEYFTLCRKNSVSTAPAGFST